MNISSFILLIALCSPVLVKHNSAGVKKTDLARQANTQTGYHGPVALGPFSINNKKGGIGFHKLLSMFGHSAAPDETYVCYHDIVDSVYLVIERGADDPQLVRGLTLSRINVCPIGQISKSSGFSAWATEKGIRLGTSMKVVVSRYGKPSQIDELYTDPEFYLSPYPLKKRSPEIPKEGRILSYLPTKGASDTSHALFGIRNGVVVWITLSDNE